MRTFNSTDDETPEEIIPSTSKPKDLSPKRESDDQLDDQFWKDFNKK